MKIYTKTGDKGGTSLLNGEEVSKNDARIHFLGTVDELTSHLGLIRARLADSAQFIRNIQGTLMTLMAYGAAPANANYFLTEKETQSLEEEIDRLSQCLPAKFEWVLPGENENAALIDIARTVARRAERCFVALNLNEKEEERQAGAYLNRLSDYLYVLGRYTSKNE